MTRHAAQRELEILLVEDNPGDVDLIREGLQATGLNVLLRVVRDGEDALAYLRRERLYASAPRPDLILLDLNLPRKDGREVMTEIKADPNLRAIPVVVLTNSQAERDILDSYNLHANCYIMKPFALDEFLRAIRLTAEFWFRVALLPAPSRD
ncbi:MAG: response regulator [Planctomycetes bacterium]|nr:response regulator [Planctomycetota bacterium]